MSKQGRSKMKEIKICLKCNKVYGCTMTDDTKTDCNKCTMHTVKQCRWQTLPDPTSHWEYAELKSGKKIIVKGLCPVCQK